MQNDKDYLILALKEAEKRKGFTAPNPAVGAVLVSQDKVISQGTHLIAGAPHAEVMALEKLDAIPKNSTLYITLEPCCHHGKTPPCTDLIKSKNISRVVFGYLDPNPLVSGKGKSELEKFGIKCEQLELTEINHFYQSYSYWTKQKRPYVTAKIAMTLDGKIAGDNRRPIKITGTKLDAFTHLHRKHSDAILTTIKTVIADNPQLNVRFDGEVLKKSIFILDKNLDLPFGINLFSTAEKITLFCRDTAPKEKWDRLLSLGVSIIPTPVENERLSLPFVISKIGELAKHSLWVEAGGTLFAELINQSLIQKAFLYISPMTLPEKGISVFAQQSPELKNARSLGWIPFEHEVCLTVLF